MGDQKRPVRDDNSIRCSQWIDLLDELNIGAFTVNTQLRVSRINYAALALIGQKEKEVLGRDCREVFVGVPCMVKCLLRKPDAATKRKTVREPDVCVRDEADHEHLLTRMATPIYDEQQNIVGCLTILQDHSPIADLIDRIHYEERSMKIILDSLDVGIFTVNLDGYITFFNKEAEKLSGFLREEVLGTHYTALFKDEKARQPAVMMTSAFRERALVRHRVSLSTRDGGWLPVRTHTMALKNEKGNIMGGLATLHDLTLSQQLKQAISDRYTFHDMIGKDPGMLKIFEKVSVVAETDATVLIEGNTGTGKDLLAKVIHSASRRSRGPFVKVNCAAIPENLLESELFGYVQGAFTGAVKDKPGRFNEADTGTIYLDEIGDLPLPLQAKLLRVLEEREFYPLGARHTQKVSVRIIAATNRGLNHLVEQHLFRRDLYYRLNIFRFLLPDLKNRRADIPLLIPYILRRLGAVHDERRVSLSEQTLQILLNADYPGNVRELENVLEHAMVICPENLIQPRHLPEYLQDRRTSEKRPASTTAMPQSPERDRIHDTLRQHRGHREKTAQALGISRITLWRRMKQHGLDA
ncbi:MAG: sigma 54-interacting transcriptional regulator [Desulfobacterales bacterium]|jgi:PAS domain S-box-containing protein|nr:sigma 54-interacting transcriptional regulator [Desulfobacterales bacterium]